MDQRCHFRNYIIALYLVFSFLFTATVIPVSATTINEGNDSEIGLEEDLAAYKRIRKLLSGLIAEIGGKPIIFNPGSDGDATLLQPEIRRQIWLLWYEILDNYIALDVLSEKYRAVFISSEDRERRKAGFKFARIIFLTQYRFALDFIALFEQNSVVDTILNEADLELGLPERSYAHFKFQYLNVIKAGQYAAFEAVAKSMQTDGFGSYDKWADEDSRLILQAGVGSGPVMTLQNGMAIIKKMGEEAWFPVQKGIASWMGNTKVWRQNKALISPEQVHDLTEVLEPGDILLERREWYMTNVGIPGYWTHAALYIGSREQRNALSAEKEVKEWLKGQKAGSLDELIGEFYPEAFSMLQIAYKDGYLPRVIEAISSGVTLTSLEHSAHCDSIAVLRPRLSRVFRAAAIVRAMSYYGRPYDYDFDFTSDRSLVCTELVVKSYLSGPSKDGLQLPLENTMGHVLTPANSFARHFDMTLDTSDQQLDLVLFLDGDERNLRAVESDLQTFRTSWKRPKWHIFMTDENGAAK